MKNWLPLIWCTVTLLATTSPGNVYSSSLSGPGKSTRSSLVPIVNVTGIPSSVNEGDATIPGEAPTECIKYSEYTITVNMTEASTEPVKVSMYQSFYYQDDYPMATEGADFEILPAEVTFAPGDLSKEFTIRIFDDAEEDTDEVLTLDFSIETNGDAEPDFGGFHNITIIDNDGASENVETTIISETFPTTTPTGWTFVPSVSGVAQWQVNSGEDGFETNFLHFQYVGSDVGPYPAIEETVETPSFDASDYSAIRLSFDERLRLDEERITGRAFVDVWTGTDWVNVHELYSAGSDAIPFHEDLSIGGQYVNASMKLRFRCIGYTGANWLIDNVKIIGVTYSNEIATETTLTPDQKYLGPNATAYFYDPSTNAILAKIKNLTSHNYGCTTVEIDRAGDGTSEWQGGYNITDKTLKVTPSNPNPAGSYEITLYYTSAELGDFQDNVTSMGKSEGGIAVGDASQAVPVTVTQYNGDYAFTATFDTGFSGFGLSDAPPGTSLPVKLLSFEGRRSSEGNVLHWVTTTETNNDYFAVERSFDAKKFLEVGRVSAAAVLSERNDYHFTDIHFGYGTTYYRLKQVDKDGSFAMTNMISIKNAPDRDIAVFPNPTRGLSTFRIAEGGTGTLQLKVVNSGGSIVLESNRLSYAEGMVGYDLNQLDTGIYQVLIQTKTNKYQYKIVKQ